MTSHIRPTMWVAIPLFAAPVLASACVPAAQPEPIVAVPSPPVPFPVETPPHPPLASTEVRATSRKLTRAHPLADLDSEVPVLESDDVTTQKALDVINDKLEEAADRAMKSMAQVADGAATTNFMNYYLSMTCSAVTAQPDLVSILCSVETYSGGVHPNRELESHNFTIRDGEVFEIDLAKLMSGEPATQALGQHAARGVIAKGALPWDEGPLPADAMRVFTLEPAGLHLHFAPYVVGGYAAGAFDFLLHWKDAENLLRRSPELESVRALAHAAPRHVPSCDARGGSCETSCDAGFSPVEAAGCGEGTSCCVPKPG